MMQRAGSYNGKGKWKWNYSKLRARNVELNKLKQKRAQKLNIVSPVFCFN
jgi:hypothetical protein